MYKGFFEDVEYVMGLIFKPFEECCSQDEDEDEDEEMNCAMGCDQKPCMRDEDDEDEDDEDKDRAGCEHMPCMKDKGEDDETEKEERGCNMMGKGPVRDMLKCMFDASDVDYDYED